MSSQKKKLRLGNPYKQKQPFWKAVKRLWRFATCLHVDTSFIFMLNDDYEIRFCRRCGRILYCIPVKGKRDQSMYCDTLDKD